MFEKILLPTDFSEAAGLALAKIKELKGLGSREVVVLHVIDRRDRYSFDDHMIQTMLSTKTLTQLEEQWKTYIDEQMSSVADQIEGQGVTVRTMVREGIPAVEILKAEKEEDITDIVMASHGRSNIEDMFMGSVSDKVVRKCQKPVYVIKCRKK
jgi:nucleotide-binding universal stress UspA family protein